MPKHGHDYLAIILIGGGSSWGRSPDKEDAISNAIAALKDWDDFFDVSGVEVNINVIDVIGYSDCSWGGYPGGWMHGKNEATGMDEAIKRPIEKIKRMTPRWKRKRGAYKASA